MKKLLTVVWLFFVGASPILAGDYDVFINPVSSKISTGCDFGNNPCASDDDYHAGIDYVSSDRNIIAVNHGRVVKIVENGKDDHGLGNTVIIEHWLVNGGYVYSCYSHLESINSLIYEKRSKFGTIEQWISIGDPIGIMGGSGFGKSNYWSVHLHFELKNKGVLESPSGNYYGYTPNYPTKFGYLNFHDYLGKVYVGDPCLPGEGSGYSGDSGDPGYYSGGMGGGTSPTYSSSKPDFYVKSVKIADDSDGEHPKESYFPNEKFYILATIGNAGIKPSQSIKVGYYLFDDDDDREKVGEESIKNYHLLKGMTHTERAEVEDIDPGTYQVRVRPDNDKVISESNENNNWSAPVTLKIKEWPNFVVEGIIFEEGTSFSPGSTAYIRAKFKNKGGDTKDGIGVASYIIANGVETLAATESIKDYHLEEDEYHWEGMTITLPNAPGKYSLKVKADPGQLVKESNESDNSLIISFSVIGSATIDPAFLYKESFESGIGGFVTEDHISANDAKLVWSSGGVSGKCLAIVNTDPASSSAWHIRAKKTGIPLEAATTQHISFYLKSSVPGKVRIQISRNISPYDNLGLSQEVDVGTEWKAWPLDFYVSNATFGEKPENIRISFDTAKIGPATVYVDEIEMPK